MKTTFSRANDFGLDFIKSHACHYLHRRALQPIEEKHDLRNFKIVLILICEIQHVGRN